MGCIIPRGQRKLPSAPPCSVVHVNCPRARGGPLLRGPAGSVLRLPSGVVIKSARHLLVPIRLVERWVHPAPGFGRAWPRPGGRLAYRSTPFRVGIPTTVFVTSPCIVWVLHLEWGRDVIPHYAQRCQHNRGLRQVTTDPRGRWLRASRHARGVTPRQQQDPRVNRHAGGIVFRTFNVLLAPAGSVPSDAPCGPAPGLLSCVSANMSTPCSLITSKLIAPFTLAIGVVGAVGFDVGPVVIN